LAVIAALLGAAAGLKPALMAAADRVYAQDSNEAWFLSSISAYRLYGVASALPRAEPRAAERLQQIADRAKDYYVKQAKDAIAADALGPAIANLEKAAAYDPQDGAIYSSLELLRAKHQVKQSLDKQVAPKP
jgi:hypothetical protein